MCAYISISFDICDKNVGVRDSEVDVSFVDVFD